MSLKIRISQCFLNTSSGAALCPEQKTTINQHSIIYLPHSLGIKQSHSCQGYGSALTSPFRIRVHIFQTVISCSHLKHTEVKNQPAQLQTIHILLKFQECNSDLIQLQC